MPQSFAYDRKQPLLSAGTTADPGRNGVRSVDGLLREGKTKSALGLTCWLLIELRSGHRLGLCVLLLVERHGSRCRLHLQFLVTKHRKETLGETHMKERAGRERAK